MKTHAKKMRIINWGETLWDVWKVGEKFQIFHPNLPSL